jgi:hypothetical protein
MELSQRRTASVFGMTLAKLTRGVRYFGALCATVAVFGFPCCTQAVAGLPACEAKSPTIDSVTLKEVTMAGISLEAQINPQGNETSYKFLTVWRELKPGERGEPLPAGSPTQEGHIGAGNSDVTVNAFLSGLQPGYTYWFEVVATSLGNNTRSTIGVPYFNPDWYNSGYEEGPPYTPPERAGCADESGNLAAAETVRKQRELEAKEAAAKEAEEASLKRRAEEHPAAVLPASCTVPSVKGDTLSVARHVIARAHCRLGRLRRPSHYHGALIVTGQTPHRDSTLRNGASVTLVLGPAHKRSPYKPRTGSTARR